MLDLVELKPRSGEPAAHRIVGETEPKMGVAGPQFLALMRGEIDDQKRAAGRKDPSRLGNRRAGLLGIMKHLVKDDAVGAAVGQRKGIHVALTQAGTADAGRLELDPREPQHF